MEDQVIDLRSDTVTRPTPAMRQAMADAIVGDDQYGEDETVHRLEAKAAALLGKEAAVYVPSGTMGNLAALLAHCGRGDEAILGDESHIFWFESGGPATLGGIPLNLLRTDRWGRLDIDAVAAAIRPERPGFPHTGVVCIENTHNRCSGVVLSLDYLRDLRAVTAERATPIHMDGARIFNAAAALGIAPSALAAEVDSVQFCLSKGLGAPVGSLVVGSRDFIANARKQRKLLGGAMRQAGVIAAAGIVALETMIERLPEDHRRARRLATGLAAMPGVSVDLEAVQTNIVLFRPPTDHDAAEIVQRLAVHGLRISNYGPRGLRMVTHYEIDDVAIERALEILETVMVRQREPAVA
ncbi:MAG: aminotransferase class I/II-fold pyridoxal phosphate-dependent enzyme [Chloroflexota bacterium]|nr:aminotransferase class I/II-fold pyridoxal phosphate-dependent enzyme [Chloroflexota bacterium]